MSTSIPMSTSTQSGTDFTAVKHLTSPPETVLAALTTTAGIARWWGETAGSAGVGDRFTVGFGSERRIDVLVESAGPRRVAWTVEAAPHTPEWDRTTIVFDLAPGGGGEGEGRGTVVRFRHHGLTPQLDCFDMCHAGWTHYLGSLVRYADTGVGDPYRGE